MSGIDRYAAFTEEELDTAVGWMRDHGGADWLTRFTTAGDCLLGDLRGVPLVVRQMLREQFEALELMAPKQTRELLTADMARRVELVDQVLSKAGR